MERLSPAFSSATSGNKKTQANRDFFGEKGKNLSLLLFCLFSHQKHTKSVLLGDVFGDDDNEYDKKLF